MKTLTKKLAVSSFTSAIAVNASVAVGVAEARAMLTATVNPLCKVTREALNAAALNLNYGAGTQETAKISIWCNSKSPSITTFSSENGGYLASHDGDKIEYRLKIGTQTDIDMSSAYSTVSQLNSEDQKDKKVETIVSISPSISGLENAGNYSDTISVTVAPN